MPESPAVVSLRNTLWSLVYRREILRQKGEPIVEIGTRIQGVLDQLGREGVTPLELRGEAAHAEYRAKMLRSALYENPAAGGGRVEVEEADEYVVINWFDQAKGGDLRGHITLEPHGPDWQVNNIDVDEDIWRKGVGTRLYQESLAYARARGGTLVSDSRRELPAELFWQKMRKHKLAERKFEGNVNYYVMRDDAPVLLPNARVGSGSPKGYPYPGWTLFHATASYRAVLNSGLLSRAQLAQGASERHIVGGGTAHAISMTIDARVAEAILIGLKVISRLVKGELSLGELLIAGSEQAPAGTADVIREWRLTPERVVLYDEGLYPFHMRWVGGGPSVEEMVSLGAQPVNIFPPGSSSAVSDPDRDYGDEVEEIPEGTQHLKVFFLGTGTHAIGISGWAPKMEVARGHRYRDEASMANNERLVEMYKRMLAMSYDEVYDPLFFLTNLGAMRELDESDLWVVAADCNAEWLCASLVDARRLGLASDFHVSSDWYHACASRLEDITSGRTEPRTVHGGDRGWGQPEPSDTVEYLGRAMAEVRVFDPSLLVNVRGYKSLDDVEYELDPEYDQPGHLIVAYPHFTARGN